MFTKILIANRGEIACRIIKTARSMGIKTVAVYSDADKRALHVQMADEAVYIGGAPATESYLVIDKIIAACIQTGAQAVHPGYGFLSEQLAFVQALEKAGIAFIGPNPRAIEVMGDKIASKKFANLAKVSTIPGYLGEIADIEQAKSVANDIGYPVMIKASAGGGGKGMRIAYSADQVAENFTRARSEAKASFGDDRIFIEKFIEDPRHIEIQVLGDKHGNIIYLAERECSIQRRNQKVLEEAPSCLLDEQTRKKMGEQAVSLARAVGYESAGTVEFVCGQDKSFYFLEMNTRLQVEHPITELVTGIDLVEQMIRVAAGEKLQLAQEDVKITGWAVESRIYAEDPSNNFMPAAGRLRMYRPPVEEQRADGVTVRNDTGVYEGGEISRHYDPMIAKLVTHAATRAQAIEAQCQALDAFVIEGIENNILFLSTLMHHPRWRSGELSTSFIADEFPQGYKPVSPADGCARKLAAVAAAIDDRLRPNPQVQSKEGCHRIVRLGSQDYELTIKIVDQQYQVCFADQPLPYVLESDWSPEAVIWKGQINGESVVVRVDISTDPYLLTHAGTQTRAMVLTPQEARLLALMPVAEEKEEILNLLSPMQALVVSLAVKAGDRVAKGSPLCVLEAMKMEISLDAQDDVVISSVGVVPGDQLTPGDVIMEFV